MKKCDSDVKNRLEQSNLQLQLKNLEHQRRTEMRMHNSDLQRIQAKYNKIENHNAPATGKESSTFTESSASKVKMYQTHFPGFCYKRNGEHKTPTTITSRPTLDFYQIRRLLFTNGTLDIDKLICLHLLSIHEGESLKMPHKTEGSGNNSPLERLIVRSKGVKGSEIEIELPQYALDIGLNSYTCYDEENGEYQVRDERLNSRLLVNEKLQTIVSTALKALKDTKSDKMETITRRTKDPLYLKKIFNRANMQKFLETLRNLSLISNAESYVLIKIKSEPPIRLEVRTKYGNLENLIYQVHRMLQYPNNRKTPWTQWYGSVNNLIASPTLVSVSNSDRNKRPKRKISKRSVISENPFRRYEMRVIAHRNFMQSIRENDITRRVFEKPFEDTQSNVSDDKSTPSRISEIERELREINFETYSENLHIKRTNCCACQEKWRETLPSPKVPNYRKPEIAQNDPYKPNQQNQISSMIKDELYKLSTYDNRFDNANNVRVILPKDDAKTKVRCEENHEEFFDIDPYDLAKISYEIADKEIGKKLDNFLNSKV